MAGSSIADPRNPKSLSARFRAKRNAVLRDFIASERHGKPGRFRILDIGGTADYWRSVGFDFLEAHDVEIVAVNHIETEFGATAAESQRISCIVGDARNLTEIAVNAFDLVHSNSVVEHVGRWDDMRAYAREVRRCAPAYYVQTPYFWFPVDPHFYRLPLFHWLPESLRWRLVRRFRIGWSRAADLDRAMAMINGVVLLDRAQFGALFPDARIGFERVALLPKSMIAMRPSQSASR